VIIEYGLPTLQRECPLCQRVVRRGDKRIQDRDKEFIREFVRDYLQEDT